MDDIQRQTFRGRQGVKFGCWTTTDEIERVAAAGFEYLELPASVLQADADGGIPARTAELLRESRLPVLAFNLFIPQELPIVGPSVEWKRLAHYARNVLERMGTLGVSVLVFGSGPARTVPPGFSRATAEEQFVHFCQTAGDYASDNGITIGIESISRRGGTNTINTLAEAVRVARKVSHPAIRVVADLGQMAPENEPWSHLAEYGEWIIHIHLSDTDRLPPGLGVIDWNQAFGFLRAADYDKTMSWECRWDDFNVQAKDSMAFVREVWSRTKTAQSSWRSQSRITEK